MTSAARKPLAECPVLRDAVVEVNGTCPACLNPLSWHHIFGLPRDPEADEQLRRDLAAVREAEQEAIRRA